MSTLPDERTPARRANAAVGVDDLVRRYARASARAGEAGLGATVGDHSLNPGHDEEFKSLATRPAAVLVPVVARPKPSVLLTRRADTLRTHSGQIAFPGGAIDAGETPREAALREANEEIGLAEGDIDRVLGPLPRYATGSGFIVTPILAVIDPTFRATPAPDEVAETFETPLDFLMDASNHAIGSAEWRGRLRRYYAIHHAADGVERRIWGATAGILRAMYERLYA